MAVNNLITVAEYAKSALRKRTCAGRSSKCSPNRRTFSRCCRSRAWSARCSSTTGRPCFRRLSSAPSTNLRPAGTARSPPCRKRPPSLTTTSMWMPRLFAATARNAGITKSRWASPPLASSGRPPSSRATSRPTRACSTACRSAPTSIRATSTIRHQFRRRGPVARQPRQGDQRGQ